MAYADIQNKVSQIRMANRILLAQKMDPNKTPETDLEGFQEQGGYAPEEVGTGGRDYDLREVNKDTPVEGTLEERKRISGGTYKGKSKNRFPPVQRKKKNLPSDADIQTKGNMKGQPAPEDIFGPDYEGGPTYLNTLLQIGGAIGGGVLPLIQQLLIRNPNAMASGFPYDFEGGVVTPRYFTPPRYRNQPFLHIRTKDITDEELFHFNNFIRSMGGGLDTVRRRTPLSIG
tara:strand:- start:12 stop:701 length:690 start_codon:yes stop_codon:yes gene_type:complete